jgi:sigma-B regulation protein RsbU (phosphoserine phosphatase)
MTNVLLVDDEQALLTVIQRLLRVKSYDVLTAKNVPDALELARQYRPAILVTDFNLGGVLDGLDLCRAFTEDPELATTRRIVISGQTSYLPGQGSLYDLFLPKPFTAQEFFKVLELIMPVATIEEGWVMG